MLSSKNQVVPAFVPTILAKFGLNTVAVAQGQIGYRNTSYAVTLLSQDVVNLIVYKREPEILHKIKNAHHIADILANEGFPVRQQIDYRVVELDSSEEVKRYAALYNYLPGQTISWEAYTQNHLKRMGMTLGQMHVALEEKAQGQLPNVVDDAQSLLQRMKKYFKQEGVHTAMSEKLHLSMDYTDWEGLATGIESCNLLSGSRPLHMDFVRGNVLFEGTVVSGIIDFEKAAFGPPVFDVARTLAFLLVDSKYKQPDKVYKYFLYSGYVKRGGMKLTDLGPTSLRESLITFFLMHDFYKFLLHNPYEFLSQNEHYTRTCDILVARGELRRV